MYNIFFMKLLYIGIVYLIESDCIVCFDYRLCFYIYYLLLYRCEYC